MIILRALSARTEGFLRTTEGIFERLFFFDTYHNSGSPTVLSWIGARALEQHA